MTTQHSVEADARTGCVVLQLCRVLVSGYSNLSSRPKQIQQHLLGAGTQKVSRQLLRLPSPSTHEVGPAEGDEPPSGC